MRSLENRHVPLAIAGLALGVPASLILAFVVVGGDDYPLASLPFVWLVSMPAVLAAIGLTRPPALLAAGAIRLPVSLLSFAGVTLPLLIPAALYFVAYGCAPVGRPRVHPAVIVALVIAAGAGAFVLTAYDTETRCTISGIDRNGEAFEKQVDEGRANRLGSRNGGGRVTESSCSEGPATANAGTALFILAGAVALVAWMSKVTPQPPDAPRAPQAPHAPFGFSG